MNFSDLIPHSSIIEYSPNGDLVAICKGFELRVSNWHGLNFCRFSKRTVCS